jgi:hypothetical protein
MRSDDHVTHGAEVLVAGARTHDVASDKRDFVWQRQPRAPTASSRISQRQNADVRQEQKEVSECCARR